MNLPNKLAIIRTILVVPFVLIFNFALSQQGTYTEINLRFLSMIIFVGACITDYFDGQIARKYNLITNFGKLIDPLADKILVISALLVLLQHSLISIWYIIIILTRELFITGLRALAGAEGIVIAADKMGKLKTVSQMVLLTVIIMFPFSKFVNNMLFLIPVILTILSGIEYTVNAKSVFK